MPTSSESLSISELVRRTGIDRSVLNRMLQYPQIKNYLYGANHPYYPPETIPRLETIVAKLAEGFKPAALAVTLGSVTSIAEGDNLPDPSDDIRAAAAVPVSEAVVHAGLQAFDVAGIGEQLGSAFAAQLIAAVRGSNLLPPPPIVEDRLITREAVAELLACKPSAVARRIPPVARNAWSWVLVQEYLAELREKAKEKKS